MFIRTFTVAEDLGLALCDVDSHQCVEEVPHGLERIILGQQRQNLLFED